MATSIFVFSFHFGISLANVIFIQDANVTLNKVLLFPFGETTTFFHSEIVNQLPVMHAYG